MADFFGARSVSAGELVVRDDPAWRFYNRYVDEPATAEPHTFTNRAAANDMALFNLLHFGYRRIGLVIVKKPETVHTFSPPQLVEPFNG